MRGAGGTDGGIVHFFIGLAMICSGVYILLNSITTIPNIGFHYRLYMLTGFGGIYTITSGMTLIPFIVGIGIVFYHAKSIIGWLLTCGSLFALIFGVITSSSYNYQTMTALDLITVLILSVAGITIFLRSLKER